MWSKTILLTLLLYVVAVYSSSSNSTSTNANRNTTVVNINRSICAQNETRAFLLSCESSCRNLRQNCRLSSRCVCKNGFFRDIKTQVCVIEQNCSNYFYLRIWAMINRILRIILSLIRPFVPTTVVDAVGLLLTANRKKI
ncbi:uncharacterized protein LOC123009471 [Tribolium madens]|uniref:uncharacterized protein LOC123009471 n=1 Tax=Tribolium madens TaxID=41895 RepID=UPI001CF73A10|nr:uncharacterized protein LOC123009471 [Tribolium madens]